MGFKQEPEEIVLGEELIDPGPNVEGQLRVKKHSYQYISIVKVLQKLLNQCDVYSQVQYSNMQYL